MSIKNIIINDVKSEKDLDKLAKLLEYLYELDRKEFIKLIKNKIKFAYTIGNKTKGKPQRKYNNKYSLIEANIKDIIESTNNFQKLKPYYVSNTNHISTTTTKSREFTTAAYLILKKGFLDCPCIGFDNNIIFEDGRHRTALALECGFKTLQFIIDNESLENLEYKKPFNFKVIKI